MVITGLTRNQFAGNRTWVRIPPSPPARRKRHIACDELFPSRTKLIARSFCCFSLPKRNRLRWVALWGCRTAVLFYQGKNIDFNRPFQVGANVISFAPTSFYACGKRDVICPLSYANGFKSQGGLIVHLTTQLLFWREIPFDTGMSSSYFTRKDYGVNRNRR